MVKSIGSMTMFACPSMSRDALFPSRQRFLQKTSGSPREVRGLSAMVSDPISQRRGVGWSGKDRALRDAGGVSVISQLASLCTAMTTRRRSWTGGLAGAEGLEWEWEWELKGGLVVELVASDGVGNEAGGAAR
jgi:hypothetical protein